MARLVASALLGLALLLASPTESQAQSYAVTVWNQLQSAYEKANGSDFSLRNYILGKLNDDAKDSWTFTLAGSDVLITGACDEDCSDLDIKITDEGGRTVAEDDSSDDVPVVRFNPGKQGRYTVEITMYDCSSDPCYFGFGIFTK